MDFIFQGKKLMMDATRQYNSIARLVNHSWCPNIKFHMPIVTDRCESASTSDLWHTHWEISFKAEKFCLNMLSKDAGTTINLTRRRKIKRIRWGKSWWWFIFEKILVEYQNNCDFANISGRIFKVMLEAAGPVTVSMFVNSNNLMNKLFDLKGALGSNIIRV